MHIQGINKFLEEASKNVRTHCRSKSWGGQASQVCPEVAAILGAKTGVAISCQLKKLRHRLAADSELHSQVKKIEKALQGADK